MPIADGAHACPFVAFAEDRDERSSVPDHRHRCYAEAQPAPRALAHQEAYCLSSAFPVCPTFQDWARRESARTRGGGEPAPPTPASVEAPSAAAAMSAGEPGDGGLAPGADRVDANEDRVPDAAEPRPNDEGEVRRNPPRDWSAPPPWLASAEGAAGAASSEPPLFLASRSQPGQGLAGSAADQLAGGPPPSRPPSPSAYGAESTDRAADGASAAGAAGAVGAAGGAAAAFDGPSPTRGSDAGTHPDDVDFEARDLPRPATPRRPRAYDQHLGGPTSGPDWERPRRYEAYPTIRTRVGLPPIPRIAVMAAAVGIAALALFFLPALLGLGGGNQASSSPTPSAAPSRSIEPTPIPAPTPIVYTIKKGDTLSKIATANGLTLAELMAANPDIKDPNKIVEGQQITIPAPQPSAPTTIGSGGPSGSPAP